MKAVGLVLGATSVLFVCAAGAVWFGSAKPISKRELALAPQLSPPAPTTPELPQVPPRPEVANALRAVRPAVEACNSGPEGIVTVEVYVAGATGRVVRAYANGPVSPDVRACVERAVRAAEFPRFTRPSFSVNFPYRLRAG